MFLRPWAAIFVGAFYLAELRGDVDLDESASYSSAAGVVESDVEPKLPLVDVINGDLIDAQARTQTRSRAVVGVRQPR